MSILDKKIGDRVRVRREQLLLTKSAMANQIDKTEREYDDFECGTTRIPTALLVDIAALLRVRVTHFFEPVFEPGANHSNVS
jgi:transcriptional regulator with XRE-family HTH domain